MKPAAAARMIVVGMAFAAALAASAQTPAPLPGPHGPGAFGMHPAMPPGHPPGPAAFGGEHGPGLPFAHGFGRSRLGALGLSDEQRDKIAALREAQRQKMWPVMGQLHTERFALRQMYRAEKLDANAIVEQQRKVDDLRRQLIRARIETRNQVVELLDPEQRKRFRAFGPGGPGRGGN